MPFSQEVAAHNLHFVIQVMHQSGQPIFLLIKMDQFNRLYFEQSQTLPAVVNIDPEGPGIPIIDMSNFHGVNVVQLTDDMPVIKEIGSHLLGTLFKTEIKVWDIIRQQNDVIEIGHKEEAHLLFDIDGAHDTVNLLSFYNHRHRDEVVAMLIKQGLTAKIILFDVRLESIELYRAAGYDSFIRFLKRFRMACVHMAEKHFPDGEAVKIERHLFRYIRKVDFKLPDNRKISNQQRVRRLFHHLYALKLVLAASFLDRCDPQSEAYQIGRAFLARYLPDIDDPNPRGRRIIRLGGQSQEQSVVVFGLPELKDLFDPQMSNPRPAIPKGPMYPPAIKISREDLTQNEPQLTDNQNRENIWRRIKINP